jgi:beta-glucosidase
MKQRNLNQLFQLARQSELVIMVVGESDPMNSEGASRADIGLPGVQQQLVETIYPTGRPMVVLIVNGRPLAVEWIADHIALEAKFELTPNP